MTGIPCDGPAYILGDNQSVLCNTTIPSSTIKKKCQAKAYHLIREGVTRDEWRISYIKSDDNDSDLLVKKMPSGEKRRRFMRNILHRIYGPITTASVSTWTGGEWNTHEANHRFFLL